MSEPLTYAEAIELTGQQDWAREIELAQGVRGLKDAEDLIELARAVDAREIDLVTRSTRVNEIDILDLAHLGADVSSIKPETKSYVVHRARGGRRRHH